MSNRATFLRPITAGTIHAQATRRHRGRTTWVWDVEISDDDGRLCAMSRMTIAVRPAPERRAAGQSLSTGWRSSPSAAAGQQLAERAARA